MVNESGSINSPFQCIAQNKVDVQVTYISSDDALWQKINTNLSADFDVFAVNTAELQRYVAAGLVSPVDRKLFSLFCLELCRFIVLDCF